MSSPLIQVDILLTNDAIMGMDDHMWTDDFHHFLTTGWHLPTYIHSSDWLYHLRLGVRVPPRLRHFLSQKLWDFHKNTRLCVENECCCPRTVNIKGKHQRSASLAFVQGIHWGPVNFPHKGPVTRKMFPFDDVSMPIEYFMHLICIWTWTKFSPHGVCINSSPLDKMAAISQTMYPDAFSWKKSFLFWLKFYWSLFLRIQLAII